MASPVKKFQKINLHDATIEDIEITPPTEINGKKAEITLLFQTEREVFASLRFADCKNIQFLADFDLLRDNAGFGNTSHLAATRKPMQLIKLINKIEKASNIEYDEAMKSPVDKKLEKLGKYTCFEVYFFGGVLRVIAKKFKYTEEEKETYSAE